MPISKIRPIHFVIGALLALALSVLLGNEAWAEDIPSPNDDEIIETMPGYGLTDYEFIEQCFSEFLTLVKDHAHEFSDVPSDKMREVISRSVVECSRQLEQYRTDETAYQYNLLPESLREYAHGYNM